MSSSDFSLSGVPRFNPKLAIHSMSTSPTALCQKKEKIEYEGTVLQLTFNGNEWKTKFSTIAGNILPIYNFFFDFTNYEGILKKLKNVNIWFSLGTILIFGYVLYKQFYFLRSEILNCENNKTGL